MTEPTVPKPAPGGPAAGGAASLDHRTELVLTVCQGAGEATLCRVVTPADDYEGSINWADIDDEERARLNHERANRRARKRSRRYLVANRLRYMWVFTRLGGEHSLHGPQGRAEMMRLGAALARTLRTELGGQPFPYWFSPELHPAGKRQSRDTCPIPDGCACGGHGWHLNFFVGQRIDHALVKRLWLRLSSANGYELRVKDWARDSRVEHLPVIDRIRAGARYGCKYAAKDWAPEMLLHGTHRYERAEGFDPTESVVIVDSEDQAAEIVEALTGKQFDQPSWSSSEWEDWDGPVCCGWVWTPPDDP